MKGLHQIKITITNNTATTTTTTTSIVIGYVSLGSIVLHVINSL